MKLVVSEFIILLINPSLQRLVHLTDLKKRKQDKKGKVIKATMLLEEALKEIANYHKEWQSLFVWHDGPLVQAMRNGDMFLVDEISLAEDSVLERLNSVLEPKRLLVITWQLLFQYLSALGMVLIL
jgi:midasin (ATPase involved in ribosome maturation)